MYCDEHTAVYHCDIVTKDGETLVTGVGETHSENLPEKMLANRVKLAEMRAFSDAVVRFLQLPAVYYTDAQILVEKDLEETPAPVLPEVNTEEKVTPITQAESAPAPAPAPAPEPESAPTPAPATETPASVIEYVYTTEDGEDGFVCVTGLHNTAMPVLRYRLNDIACIARKHNCPCGNPNPIINLKSARMPEFLILDDPEQCDGWALYAPANKENQLIKR